MSHLDYLKNYRNDLVSSQKTPLLIELNQFEIIHLDTEANKNQQQSLPALVAQQIYDKKQGSKATNIIVIDGDAVTSPDSFILLETLLEQLRHELKSIKNLTTLKESLKAAASVATGGMLNDFIGDHLDKGINFIFDEVDDHFSSLLADIAINKIDLSNTLLSNIEDLLHDNTGNSLGDVINKINKQELNLSTAAKSELNILSNVFSKTEKIDVFQLTFKLLLAIALDAPKLIYINNPHKLDDNSIALLSLLFSFAKNKKDSDTHVGLSVLYTYTDENFHLYDEVNEELKGKQQLLVDQRRFVQRYAMLEKPGSDIPIVAVKSSLFIGRNKEIEQLSSQFTNRKAATLSVISGEPGIGKTALVNQHLTNIRKQGKVITLTLLNEVGHSSSNTGLSSLEKSILDEAKRLELLVDWKDKGFNFVKNIASKDNAIKAIGTIFSGVDKVLSVADAGYQRVMLDSHVDTIRQSGMGDLDNKQTDEKQRQFTNLDNAIEKLKGICSEPLPMVLFIDDLQWIDNTASEYILTRLIQQPDLYIVATIRPSDAATIFKKKLVNKSVYHYSLALLNACEVNGFDTYDQGVDSSVLQAEIINLKGFDQLALTELIAKVIQGESTQHASLANSIFTTLAGAGANDVNTLFAVETVNMLCDKKLYSENTFERLILDTPLRFNTEVQDIERTLAQTFAILQSKYQDSLTHANKSSNGQRFNLMAYAVLEERLHLLKLYFGDQGNTAVNTLLFSSLLGAPFSSDLVKKVMLAVASSDVPELLPLKLHLIGSESDTHLRPEHYVIIEEVYEILRRLSANDDKYQYRHGLLHAFLDKQFDYLLDSVLVDNSLEAKNELIGVIASTVVKVMHSLDFYNIPRFSLTIKQADVIQFYRLVEINILAKGFTISAERWANDYTASLNKMAASFTGVVGLLEAKPFSKKSLAIMEKLYALNNDRWAEGYTNCINSLAIGFGSTQEVISLQETSLTITKKLYTQNNDRGAKNYNSNLNGLAINYQQVGRTEEAISLFETSLAIREKLYAQNNDLWAEEYTSSLSNVAYSYQEVGRTDEAISLFETSLPISKTLYAHNNDLWTGGYTARLNNLASLYKAVGRSDEAIPLEETSLAISKTLYAHNNDLWAEEYADNLNNLAASYASVGRIDETISLFETLLSIREKLYAQDNDLWAGDYTARLNSLASLYEAVGRSDEAISLEETSLAIIEKLYAQDNDLWAGDYTARLNNLASLYKAVGRSDEAISLEETSLAIIEKFYTQDNILWAEPYTSSLTTLAASYQDNQQFNEAIRLRVESLAPIKFLYEDNPTVWAEIYASILIGLVVSYQDNQQFNDAIRLREELLDPLKFLYKVNPTVWAERYTIILINQAESYKNNQQLPCAIELEAEALGVITLYSHLKPKYWRKLRLL